jgi:tetratricopeptide (TPR) repeat protein
MNMDDNRCARCAGPLAAADSVCAACGEPVAPAKRASLLAGRAEALAKDGLYAQAARTAETLLALPLQPQDAKLWWRKRGAWLQRSEQPGAQDAAEAALHASLLLDDSDDLSHQLWIDLLHRRGSLDKARAEYKARLERNPEDAVAQRHLASLRLMDEIKLAPPPKLNLPPQKDGLLLGYIRPTPWKMITVGSGLLFCVIMLVYGLVSAPQIAPAQPILPLGGAGGDDAMVKLAGAAGDPMAGLGQVMKMATDPMSNVVQIVIYAAYLFWGWKDKQNAD